MQPTTPCNAITLLTALPSTSAKNYHEPPRPPRLHKTVRESPDGDVVVDGYDNAARFDLESVEVTGPSDLLMLFNQLAARPNVAMVRGEGIDSADAKNIRRLTRLSGGEPPMIRSHPVGRNYLLLDIDGHELAHLRLEPPRTARDLERIAHAIRALLPEWLRDTTMVVRWSQTAGLDGWTTGRLHLVVFLTRPVFDLSLVEHHELISGPHLPLDTSVFRPGQLIYCAPPEFIRCADPIAELDAPRVFLLKGKRDVADPPAEFVDGPTWRALQDAREQERRESILRRIQTASLTPRTGELRRLYAERALADANELIRTAVPNTRHQTIKDEAFSIGGLAGGGYLDPDRAVETLAAAGRDCGSVGGERTARECFEAGLECPRDLSHIGLQRTRRASTAVSAEATCSPRTTQQPQETLVGGLPMVEEPGDDVGISRALEDYLTRSGPILVVRQQVWQYDPARGFWVKLPDERLSATLQLWSGELCVWGTTDNGETDWRPVRLSKKRIHSIVSLFKDRLEDPFAFDHVPNALVLADGAYVVDGDQLVWRDHDPDLRQRHGYTWTRGEVEAAVAPLWFEQTLRLADGEEAIVWMLFEWIGVALLGLATHFQRSVFLFGPGGGGKSTWIDVVVCTFPPNSTCALKLQDCGKEHFRASVDGKLLVAVSDLPRGTVSATAAADWKSMVTGDPTSARHLYTNPMTMRPKAAWLFSSNHLPTIMDDSDGFWRRVLLMNCAPAVTGEKDRRYGERLAAEGPGILRVFIEGARRVLERGDIDVPETILQTTEDWRQQNTDHPWREAIAAWIATHGAHQLTTFTLLTQAVCLSPAHAGVGRNQMQIGDVMRQLGYERVRRTISGERMYVYERLPLPHPPLLDDDGPDTV